MITAIEITSRAPFVGGATFGTTGAYERLDGVAIGELDPEDPANRGIVNIIVGFAPLKPAEFVIIKLQQMAGQIQT